MNKQMYTKPQVEMELIPQEALMGPIAIPGSGEGPSLAPSRAGDNIE